MMQRFDGFSVDTYQGKFSGTFDVDVEDGETYLRFGNKIALIVLATVGAATMSEDTNGDVKRVNTMKVEAVRFTDDKRVTDLLGEMGVSVRQAELPMFAPESTEKMVTPDGYVIDEDGEILTEVEDSRPPKAPPEEEWYETKSVARIPPPKDSNLAAFLAEVPQ